MGAAMSGADEAEEGGFLDRWSRRKRAAAGPAPALETPGPEAPGTAAPHAEPTPEETAEAVAALPPLESIDARTDLAPWLRRGVPAALKNAALRRMWSLDPAIRDYRDCAVDYAWDWNTPGGLPGSSGRVDAESVAGLLRDLGRDGSAAPARAEAPAAAPEPGAPAPSADGAAPSGSAAAPVGPDAPQTAALDGSAADGPAPAPRARPRRHGGAAPV
jgi:hypothetical protein